MTQYATMEQLEQRLTGERLQNLCQVSGEEELHSFTEQLLARAQDLVDSFLRKRYELPLREVPPLVQEWTFCIAEYELYKRSQASNVPEKIRMSYEDTLSRLRDLAAGAISFEMETFPREKVNSSLEIRSAEPFPEDPHCMKHF